MSIEKFNNFIYKTLMVFLLFMTGVLAYVNKNFSNCTHSHNFFKPNSVYSFQQQNISINSLSARKDCVIKKIKNNIDSLVCQYSAVFSCCKIAFRKALYSFVRITPINKNSSINALFYIRAP